MKFLTVLVLIVLLSCNAYAENSKGTAKAQNVMEVMLFFSPNALPAGAVRSKVDREKKNIKYFDENNRLVKEQYLDKKNTLIIKKYDKNGKVVSQEKLTEKEVFGKQSIPKSGQVTQK